MAAPPRRDRATGRFVPASPLAPEDCLRTSTPLDVWLPATFRPGKPVTHSPLPAFDWERADAVTTGVGLFARRAYGVSRICFLRVWLQREWFSSGEDEMLGLVIWPPDLFAGTQAGLDQGKVSLSRRPDGSVSPSSVRIADMLDFADGDLGPGGIFVTRWGGDPTRADADPDTGTRGMLVPATAFADYPSAPVACAAMPVGALNQDGRSLQTLQVALLTYVPRFDVGREQWYVDLRVVPAFATDPFIRLGLVRYQPHAPPDLQVSQPIVEWAQILPQRRLTAVVERNVFCGQVRQRIEVTVCGPAALGVAPLGYGHVDPNLGKPVMLMEVWHETGDEINGISRIRIDQAEPFVGVPEDGQTVWHHDFQIDPASLPQVAGGIIYVYVEETDRRLPATYVTEPLTFEQLDGGTPEHISVHDTPVMSGPRYSARIDLT